MVVPLSLGLRERKASDGLLSSEDLKGEKVITTPLKSVSHAFVRRAVDNNIEE
jgi:hypothetical protein